MYHKIVNFPVSFAHGMQLYGQRLRSFHPNARLYLINVMITGATMGVFRLMFNFYALSIGLGQARLGTLVTINSFSSLVAALPMGYLADNLGRKLSLLISGALSCLAIAGMVLWPTEEVIYLANVVFGVAQSLAGVTMSPFLMENSREEERTYLFSYASGLQTAFGSVGNWVGGYLPTWMGGLLGVGAVSSRAYGASLMIIAIASAVALVPLLFIRSPKLNRSERTIFAPIAYAAREPALLGRLILPMLLTSLGAGLIMPFMNIFFRQNYGQPDPVIGTLFAWGSLAMGVGLMIAPPLAERYGKIQLVVITQGLSIPFLILLGFAPWFWMSAAAYYVRVALMNMSGPVYQTYVMEKVEPSARATVASLVSMSWNFGWFFSPTLSGYLQAHSGFTLPYIGTVALYSLSVFFYWAFFWRGAGRPSAQPVVPLTQPAGD